jgi:hypothetical protein
MDTLINLFGSAAKVKIIKLFVFNPGAAYDIDQIAEKAKESKVKVRKEVAILQKMKLVRRKSFYKIVTRKSGKNKKQVRVKAYGWTLDQGFKQLVALRGFLVSMNHLGPKDIANKLNRAGNIKLIITAGVFNQDHESRVDLLVVGDHIKRGIVDSAVRTIEAEIGQELRYAVFETPDFQYRLGLYDKLIHDILDFPHSKIVNKLGIR